MCDDLPVIVRSTTLTRVPHSTLRIAAANAASTGLSVYISGCWPSSHSASEAPGMHFIGLASSAACDPAYRELRLRNPTAKQRLARLQPMWAAVELLTAQAALRVLGPTCAQPRRAGAGAWAAVAAEEEDHASAREEEGDILFKLSSMLQM